jgi:hypothetical protein
MKKNIKITIYILLPIITFILGFYLGDFRNSDNLICKDGKLYFDGSISSHNLRDFEYIGRVSHWIRVKGILIQGKITSISISDIKDINEIISKVSEFDPVISIEVINSKSVKVTTEKLLNGGGTTNGGGKIYHLYKLKDHWILNKDLNGIWVS